MIVVFVVDTSPSMAEPAQNSNQSRSIKGISRLDVAKMAVERLVRLMDKRIVDHNRSVLFASAQQVAAPLGKTQQNQHQDVGRLEDFDEFLLLSTSLQPHSKDSSKSSSVPARASIETAVEALASCGAGGRLLVGCINSAEDFDNMISCNKNSSNVSRSILPHPPSRADFERELKLLSVANIPVSDNSLSAETFPTWAGGAVGLNAALSHGLGLLSRYRLSRGRLVEHFGMGRLPWFEHQMIALSKVHTNGTDDCKVDRNVSPLLPACLVLLTDGECLRLPSEKGGGGLRLQFGNIPLREFYKEPFRWDQRIFILHINDSSSTLLHQSLQTLCEVTGGAHMKLQSSLLSLPKLLSKISPPIPSSFLISDPLLISSLSPKINGESEKLHTPKILQNNNPQLRYVNGGPILCFQALERGANDETASLYRAMLLFSRCVENSYTTLNQKALSKMSLQTQSYVNSPIWCIPESFYPSKKFDILPPRPSQPLLHYSKGSSVFDPMFVMKALHHLDQLQVSIRQSIFDANDNPSSLVHRMIQRDIFICEWLHEPNDKSERLVGSSHSGAPRSESGKEYFSICVKGAGKPTNSGEGVGSILNIGILHVPKDWCRLKDIDPNVPSKARSNLTTLTLLPPDPHILIPLLIRVAEAELRLLKRTKDMVEGKSVAADLMRKKSNTLKTVQMDDRWKSDFRDYLYRLPPYYLPAIRHALRPLLPLSVQSILCPDGEDILTSLCLSRSCLNKIIAGEKAAKDGNKWLQGIEKELSLQGRKLVSSTGVSYEWTSASGTEIQEDSFKYGQYNPSLSEHSYKAYIRNLPPPWKSSCKNVPDTDKSSHECMISEILSELPTSCLLPYYESRRRLIFGYTGLTTRGLHVEGVNNDGVNTQYISSERHQAENLSLIALANVGADTINHSQISCMSDFRERLHWSRAPLAGYGGSNASGSAVTTAADGAPTSTVDDDVFPQYFFNSKTGDFNDSSQTRLRARMMINFGNPFEDKRGGSIVPEKYESHRPPSCGGLHGDPNTPPNSPPSNSYEAVEDEGEGEAAFTGKRPLSLSKSLRQTSDLNILKRKAPSSPSNMHVNQVEGIVQGTGAKKVRPPPPPLPKPSEALLTIESINGIEVSNQLSSHALTSPPALKLSTSTASKTCNSKPVPPKIQNNVEIASTQPLQLTKQTLVPDPPLQLQNPDSRPNINLPQGWICVWSKSQKHWYFFDTKTNKSIWEWPPVKST